MTAGLDYLFLVIACNSKSQCTDQGEKCLRAQSTLNSFFFFFKNVDTAIFPKVLKTDMWYQGRAQLVSLFLPVQTLQHTLSVGTNCIDRLVVLSTCSVQIKLFNCLCQYKPGAMLQFTNIWSDCICLNTNPKHFRQKSFQVKRFSRERSDRRTEATKYIISLLRGR